MATSVIPKSLASDVNEINERFGLYSLSINARTTEFSISVPQNVYIFFYGRIGQSDAGMAMGVIRVNKADGSIAQRILKSDSITFSITADTSGLVTFTAPSNWSYLVLLSELPLTRVS